MTMRSYRELPGRSYHEHHAEKETARILIDVRTPFVIEGVEGDYTFRNHFFFHMNHTTRNITPMKADRIQQRCIDRAGERDKDM